MAKAPEEIAKDWRQGLRDAIRPEVKAEVSRYIGLISRIAYGLYVFSILILVVVSVVLYSQLADVEKIAHQNTRDLGSIRTLRVQEAVELKQCERVRILRGEINRENGASYILLAAFEKQQTDSTVRLATHALRTTIRFLPQTDCQAVAHHPLTYKTPQPILYADAVKRGLVSVP